MGQKLCICITDDEVLLDVDNVAVWRGSLADWSFALANPWSPPTQAVAVEAPCDIEDSA